MPAFQPDWRKSAVRNDRGDDGNVSIIRSLVRAILLPGNRTHVRNLGSCRHPASETIPKWQNQGGGIGALQAPATILFLVKPALQGVWALGFALPPCGFQVARSLTVRERHWLQLDSNLTPIGTGRKRERHHSPRLRSWKFGFDFHTPPPYLFPFESVDPRAREQLGNTGALRASWEQEPNHLSIRSAQTLRYCSGVEVQRRADVRVTKQFLLYLNVRAVLVQKSRIGVPKGVPAESLDSDFPPRGQQPATLCSPRMQRPPCTATGEDP